MKWDKKKKYANWLKKRMILGFFEKYQKILLGCFNAHEYDQHIFVKFKKRDNLVIVKNL